MTSAAVRPPGRRRAAIWITLGIVVVLVIAFFIFANLYTDVLWFSQVGYLNVLTTGWFGGTTMFFIGFLAMAVPLWLCMFLAYRLRPVYAKLDPGVGRYQQVVEPLRRLATYGIPVLFGLFAGAASASRWQTAALWLNGVPAGKTDPQFHLDVSFYMFALPFYRSIVAFMSAVTIIALLATIATSYLYGSVRVAGREVRISRAARVQIAVIAAFYLLLQAISIWLDRYASVTDSTVDGRVNGAAYTDVTATIPGRAILAGIAVLVALLFVLTAFIGRWRYPLVGTALLIVSAIIVGVIYPWGVQKLVVAPSEKTVESPYISRSIDSTRQAFDVNNVKVSTYDAKTDAKQGALRQDADTTASIRILDPAVVSGAFAQLQQFRQYYGFNSTLDVDRYTIDGKEQDSVVAVRELHQSGLGSSGKYNETFVYTHGYGLVAAYGNKRQSDGQPDFFESGIPTSGKLGDYQPRVYFGEDSPKYSIVGAPASSKPIELDYPAGSGGQQATYSTYTGNGGPKLDNLFTRLAYALKFQDEQFVLSDAVNNDSQVLYNRDPRSRVQQVAPYLKLDSDPYPSVVNGHIVWIVDGYTTSNEYPYSQEVSYGDAISDSQNASSLGLDNINYIRNSVKATVDAYTGKVTLYAWDASDPVLKTWEKIYPNTVKPMSDMSGALMSHVRYPTDLFKVQRDILARYHVTDPGAFFSNTDAWQVSPDPSGDTESQQPPYYLTMQMPGQSSPEFSIYTTYIPQSTSSSNRSILKGYLAVDSNAGKTAGKKSADYGTLRLLRLPSDDTIPGPGQVQNNFDSDPSVSAALNLLRQGSTKVINGNLLTLPVGGGLLYVEPVYIQSSGSTSYPLLQKVLVAFGDKIAFEDTLDGALDVLFGGDSGATAGDTGAGSSDTGGSGSTGGSSDTGGSGSGSGSSATSTENQQLQAALDDAKQALADRETALKAGDWAAYGVADARLKKDIAAALAASQAIDKQSSGSSSSSGSK
ncbi:UPF0182 family membrane protein [Humibacter ginsenosidimutans]|uniref:UPF0182 family membrane protein n=1 Tax=Humibacter ginsenosidimutans TaxID=2599293 RepID=UPI001AEFE8BB|nr:UPF0182 family protein [Humibacter ginsenosidimutans]